MKQFVKILLLVTFVGFICFWTPLESQAHEGYKPFVLINDKEPHHNPISTSSLEHFDLSHEIAAEDYLVLTPIRIWINGLKLEKSLGWLQNAKYRIDFGDGEQVESFEAIHSYQKIGVYLISVYGKSGENKEQLLTTIRVVILPMQNYLLVKPVIRVNGTNEKFAERGSYRVSFDRAVTLDSEFSEAGSSAITEIFWDLGDGHSSLERQIVHQFGREDYQSQVILRIKNADGLWSDRSLQLVNTDREEKQAEESKPLAGRFWSRALENRLALAGVIIGVIVGVVGVALRRYFKK